MTFNAGAAYPARPRPHASIAVINSTNLVEALITADSDVDAPLGSVILSATDETAFTSDVVAVSVAGAFAGGSSIALSISFALATTDLGGTVSTQINDSDVDAGVDIWLTSLANGTVSGDGVGVALSLSAAAGSHSRVAGAGAFVTNTIARTSVRSQRQNAARPGRDRGQPLLQTATDSIHSTADASRASVSVSAATRPRPGDPRPPGRRPLSGNPRGRVQEHKWQATAARRRITANSESELLRPRSLCSRAGTGIGRAAAGAARKAGITSTAPPMPSSATDRLRASPAF